MTTPAAPGTTADMPAAAAPLFVVVLTDAEQGMSTPRAIGPFDNFDVAQTFSQTLVQRWESENRTAPNATVVRVEPDLPGVVVGEL